MESILSFIQTNIVSSPWMISIYIAVVFFVTGQILLRKSFFQNTDYTAVSIAFGVSIGLAASTFLLLGGNPQAQLFTEQKLNKQLLYAILSGFVFFFGNFFWIRSISSNKPLGNIRVIMSGIETITLFLAGFLFFKEVITKKQLLGTALIISGIHIFGSN